MTVKELETAVLNIIYAKYPKNVVTHYKAHYYVSFYDMQMGKTRRIHCANTDRLVVIYNKYKPKMYTSCFDVWLYVDIYKRISNSGYVECRPFRHETVRIKDIFIKCKGVCKYD